MAGDTLHDVTRVRSPLPPRRQGHPEHKELVIDVYTCIERLATEYMPCVDIKTLSA
jgi:hypothetical protein